MEYWLVMKRRIKTETRMKDTAICWLGPESSTATALLGNGYFTNDGCQGNRSVEFEVWRPMTSTTTDYQLVGANEFNSSSCGMQNNTVTFGIAPIFQIPVEPGYIIGWNQKPNSLRISLEAPQESVKLAVHNGSSTASVVLGGYLTFNLFGSSAYSLKVMIVKGEYPSLDNLPAFVNVTEGAYTTTSVIFTVFASQINNRIYADAVPLSFGLTPAIAPFEIRNPTGRNGVAEIYVVGGGILDYETQSVHVLSIAVTGLGLTTSSTLTVNVIDVNERHIFTNLPNSVDVSAASTSAGDEVFVLTIYDPDLNPVMPVRYYLSNWSSAETATDNPPFSIDPDTGSVTANVDLSKWTLKTPTTATYPSSVTYEIGILATDGLHSAFDTLNVTIKNVKQPPVFHNLPANIAIAETTPPNTIIFKVFTAPSSDQVTYEIANAFDSLPFCIDRLSGDVSLCSYAKLDACRQSFYSVQIKASDSGLDATEFLYVTVNLVDSAPVFNQSTYYATINEKCNRTDCTSGQAIVTLTVFDRNCNGDSHRCTIIPGFGSEFFDLKNCTELINVDSINLDNRPEYETIVLLVEVRDSLNLTGYSKVFVNVLNTNDFAPIFNEATYYGWSEENLPGGKTVLTVAATDADWSKHPNGQFEYSILPEDTIQHQFEVESKSGIVKTKQPLDSETQSSYSFTVVVTDHGTHFYPLNGSASVVVTIGDVNDHRPEIACDDHPPDEPYPTQQPCFYNLDLVEDAKVGNNVSYVTFTASDLDNGPADNITFHLLVPDDYFNLDNRTGLITVKKSVESYTKYPLYVYASDNGSPALWSRITNVRIDTYRRDRQYVDLTVKPASGSFDKSAFLAALREVTDPWLTKIVSSTTFSPEVQTEIIVTVYALADNSTYELENLGFAKIFVDRDEMLNKLQANIYGDPSDILESPLFAEFPVVKVMPTYVNWWLDTVEGIATIVCLSLLGLIFLIIMVVALLKCLGLLCFKKKEPVRPMHAWDEKEPSTARPTEEANVRHRSAQSRRASVSSVHSVVIDKDL